MIKDIPMPRPHIKKGATLPGAKSGPNGIEPNRQAKDAAKPAPSTDLPSEHKGQLSVQPCHGQNTIIACRISPRAS